jgi:diguanylate cyclase (GGDEF)-like protein
VVHEAAARGLLASIARLDDVARSAERQLPDATVIDLDHAEFVDDQLLRDGGLIRGGPVVALSSGRRLADRVTAARLGAQRYLPKPVTAVAIVDAVEALWPMSRPVATVVAVDDDPVVLDTLRALLAPDHIDLVTVSEQEGFWLALQDHQPALVILDVDMPGVNGIELCRVLRSDERWQQVGVVFLTSRGDADTLREVFAAGADDLVVKPVVGPELRTRINSRIERTDLHRRLAETDGLTGLANRATLQRELDRMLAADDSTPLCFALLDLDHFKRVNDTHGHQVGDEVLRRLAELMPTAQASSAGRWGGEEFGVLFECIGTDEAYRRVEDLLKRFRDERFHDRSGSPFMLSFSAGLAGYPDDADDANALYRAADVALYRAKARGRARVVAFSELGSDVDTVRAVDVVVIDDDDLLASLLVDAICNRGWTVERLADGHDAIARLTGPSADLRARAILLDVDLPGLDGLAVLRQLARSNVVPQSRVIMLTARSREDEVVEAFQLGAFDHVAKPFSASVLLERLRRIVEG